MMQEVIHKREQILCSGLEPVEMLERMFRLCQNEFDITDIKRKQPKLYRYLEMFCDNILTNDSELMERAKGIAAIFNDYKYEIRMTDTHLYYVLLNFIDMLKIKGIYHIMVYEATKGSYY